jgi:hypothetical protein
MSQRQQEIKEKNFLEACGFDMEYGFWSEDVKFWSLKEPLLYKEYCL